MKKQLTEQETVLVVQALMTVSFYARVNVINPGDYADTVNPVLKKIGVTTGQLYTKTREAKP